MVTVIDDREGDIYEKWARLPDATHASFDARQPRPQLGRWRQVVPRPWPACPRPTASRSTCRRGRANAALERLAWRYASDAFASVDQAPAPIAMRRPRSSCSPSRFASLIRPPGDAICWRLLTTHTVESVEQALTVIGWYRLRWHIEQLFRTLKRQGLRIEQSVVEDGEALEKLAVDRAHRCHHHHAARAGALRRQPRRARQPRVQCRADRGPACAAEEVARAYAQAAKSPSARQLGLGRLDHRTSRRLDAATTATNPQAPSPCETGLSASTASSMAITSPTRRERRLRSHRRDLAITSPSPPSRSSARRRRDRRPRSR